MPLDEVSDDELGEKSMILWSGFVACTLVIVYSGIKLAKYGDIIAEKTGLGKTLTGMVLLATVTSLPELVTGISSVTYIINSNVNNTNFIKF